MTVAERGDVHTRPDRFVTHWIEYDGERAQEVNKIDGVLVPRADGFWRVTVTRACSDSEPDDPRVHCADSIWTGRALEAIPGLIQDTVSNPCTTEYFRIDFASPVMLSVSSRYWQSDCSQRSFSDDNRAIVRRYESDEPVPFGALGAGAGDAYRKAAMSARNVAALDGGPPSAQSESCQASVEAGSGWRIHRDRDHWAASLFQQHGSELCILEAPIDWKLTAQVLGSAEAPVDWAAIVRVLPQAVQAFASPDGKLAVVVLPDVIRIYALRRGAPTRQLVEYQRKDVVTVQWAVPPLMAEWTKAMAAIK